MKYIDDLLQGAEVVWKPLGEVAEIYGGLTGKSKADFEDGNALFVSYKNIYGHYEINPQELSTVKVPCINIYRCLLFQTERTPAILPIR